MGGTLSRETFVIPRLYGEAKAVLVTVQHDESAPVKPPAHYEPETGIVAAENLYPLRDQTVPFPKLGHTLDLSVGEPLNVGYSAKFERGQLTSEAAVQGFDLRAEWIDPQ